MSNVSLKVKIFDAKGTQVLQVSKSALTIGSASHCDVVLDHPTVHPEHARAWLEGGRVWVQDLGGEHGTSLNEIRLPGLKPMLVRELDVLRLGQSGATLGVEPNLVRAPVVKSRPIAAAEEPAKNPLRDAESSQRKAELENLGRDLAEVRLQLQMARLEKNSNQELASQLQNLKDEVKSNQEQKSKWTEQLKQMEDERQQQRRAREVELKDLKLRLEREARDQRERDAHLLETSKRDSVGELAKQMRSVSSILVKRWATRPLSQDMIFEWEGEMVQIFRRVLLGDTAGMTLLPDLPPLPQTPSHPTSATNAPVPPDEVTATRPARGEEEPASAVSRAGRSRPNPAKPFPWQPFVYSLAGLFVLLLLLWAGNSYLRKPGRDTLSRREATPEPARQPAARFEPKQSRKYRASYTDNVLFLENYVDAEQNADFRKRWVSELNKAAVGDWKMNESAMAPLVAKEQSLIQDLNRIKNGITTDRERDGVNQMRARETAFQHDLDGIFKKRTSVDRFLKFKRDFYVRNQQYLTKEAN